MGEKWKPVVGYEGHYKVSSLGRVKSLKRSVPLKRGGYRKIPERIVSISVNSRGYEQVTISLHGKKEFPTVHKLMAIAFLDHTPCGWELVVDHINNTKTDNRLDNLQIITQRENTSKDKKGSSRFTGVYKAYGGSWVAKIRIEGKKLHLGTFKKEIDAHKAYQNALKNL